MKSLVLYVLAATFLMGCQSNSNSNSGSVSKKNTEVPLGYTGPIDLAKLHLKENAPALLKANKIKLEAVSDTDMTMLGLDRIKSRAAEALQYGEANLSGHENKLSNYAVFHYDENSKRLVFLEVVLYTRDKAAALGNELEKLGKPVFEKKLPDGSLTLDDEGNAIPRKPDEKTALPRLGSEACRDLLYI